MGGHTGRRVSSRARTPRCCSALLFFSPWTAIAPVGKDPARPAMGSRCLIQLYHLSLFKRAFKRTYRAVSGNFRLELMVRETLRRRRCLNGGFHPAVKPPLLVPSCGGGGGLKGRRERALYFLAIFFLIFSNLVSWISSPPLLWGGSFSFSSGRPPCLS